MSKKKVFSSIEELDHSLKTYPQQSDYLAMYSSFFNGIVKDPRWMWVPIDDHLVHRGDGVFEAFKWVGGRPYLFDKHMDRLEFSCAKIELSLPWKRQEIESIVSQLKEEAHQEELLFRLYVSRGPGGFSPNPYTTIGSQLYIVATRLHKPSEEKYQKGVSLIKSQVPIKGGWLSQVKSCNYLPNVMMKKEAIDAGADYSVNFSEDGFLGEGATENIVVFSKDRFLYFPSFQKTLKGTTLVRLQELSDQLVKQGLIRGMREHLLSEQDLLEAREVFLVGTTIDVMPVVKFENHPIGDGRVGSVAQAARQLLLEDQKVRS
ncbi:MAG: peptidase [Bdellovibrio sp.]|nr:MAG: peptidase [Bdellovibrio sp.]